MQWKYSYTPDLLHQTLPAVPNIPQNNFDKTHKNNFLNILFAVLICTVQTLQTHCAL